MKLRLMVMGDTMEPGKDADGKSVVRRKLDLADVELPRMARPFLFTVTDAEAAKLPAKYQVAGSLQGLSVDFVVSDLLGYEGRLPLTIKGTVGQVLTK